MGRVAAARQRRRAQDLPLTEPLFEPTYSVSELCGEIRTFLTEAFPAVWVAGEVNRVFTSRRGHLYFELVEKGQRDEICGKLDAVVWRSDYERIRAVLARTGQTIEEGIELRCRAKVDFYGAGGRLQLVVREVDPVFTLGLLAQRRQETLAALAAAGLLEKNRALPLPVPPLSIALVTSAGSAAYHDFLSTLQESGYGFRVLLLHSAVQGREAERQVVSAFGALAGAAIDCVALIRGGGSRSDLAVFDSRAIAEAVASSPVPVLTGLGHQIDESIADRVAHTALKTPTKVAELLIERVRAAEQAVTELARGLAHGSRERLRTAHEELGAAERGVELARLRLGAAGNRLEEVARALARTARGRLRAETRRLDERAERLEAAATRRLERERQRPPRLAGRLVTAARGRLREIETRLQGFERLARELAPGRVLERGYSITRDESGTLLRDAAAVAEGALLTTELASGALTSRVEESR